jgi:hypothetical protein
MGGLDRRWALTVWALFEAQGFFRYSWTIPSWFLLSFEELAVLVAGICYRLISFVPADRYGCLLRPRTFVIRMTNSIINKECGVPKKK